MYTAVKTKIIRVDSNGELDEEISNTKLQVNYDFRKEKSAELKKKLHTSRPDSVLSLYLIEQGYEMRGVVNPGAIPRQTRFEKPYNGKTIELICYSSAEYHLQLIFKGKGDIHKKDFLDLNRLQEFLLTGNHGS